MSREITIEKEQDSLALISDKKLELCIGKKTTPKKPKWN
jgi:hypothetical protein